MIVAVEPVVSETPPGSHRLGYWNRAELERSTGKDGRLQDTQKNVELLGERKKIDTTSTKQMAKGRDRLRALYMQISSECCPLCGQVFPGLHVLRMWLTLRDALIYSVAIVCGRVSDSITKFVVTPEMQNGPNAGTALG
ncbi:hypothetical protein Trydic_g940 [Trypoxylus dichotomus]